MVILPSILTKIQISKSFILWVMGKLFALLLVRFKT
jgi:hypothetical protein